MSDPSHDRLLRLQTALDVYLEFQAEGGDRDELLARHPDLRDVLEPMLEDRDVPDSGDEDGAPALGQGRLFGDYRIVREVGRGGMGVVFEAEQISLGRRVALKLLHGHLALSPRAIARFRAEAGAAGRLRHPSIVPVYEVGEREGHHFFSMEFVDGLALNALVHGGEGLIHPRLEGKSRVAQAAALAAQVADALQCAHDSDLIHRDVKPHNIMITGGGEVKLLDFGLAKHLDQRQASASGFIGTPYYMSPEQATGDGRVGPRSDIFSLGVVLYELLTGARPFPGETPQAVARAIESRDPVPLNRAAPRTPRDLQTICHKAMEKLSSDRYSSAGAMAADLRRFLRMEPILAEPPSAWDHTIKLLRRHRGVALAAGLFAIALGTTITLFAVDQWKADATIRAQSERAESSSELAHRGILQLIQTLPQTVGTDPDRLLEDRARIVPVMELCIDYLLQVDAEEVERQRHVGVALAEIGKLQHRLRNLPGAIEAVDRALEVIRRVARVDPGRRELVAGFLLQRLRYRHELQGASDAEFSELDDLCRQLVEEDPTDDRLLLWMEALLERGGFMALMRIPGASEMLGRCLRIVERVSPERAESGTVRVRRGLLRACQAICALVERDREQAQQHVRIAVDHVKDALQPGAPELEALQVLIVQAQVYGHDKDLAASEAALRKVQSLLDSMDPSDANRPHAVKIRLHNSRMLGQRLLATGRSEEADAVLGAARDAVRPWMPIARELPFVTRIALGQLLQLCGSARLMGDLGEAELASAERLFLDAEGLLSGIAETSAVWSSVRSDLGGVCNNLASVYNQRREWRKALAYAERAVEIQQEVVRATPQNGVPRVFLGIHLSQLGLALAGLARLPDALDAFEEATLWTQHVPTMGLVARRCAAIVESQKLEQPELADRAAAAAGRALQRLLQRDRGAAGRLWNHSELRPLRATELAQWAAEKGL